MREWTSPYNPFNSLKVLMWRNELEAIAREEYLPPVTVDTDPTNTCNYNCVWCNAFDYMKKNVNALSEEHLLKLADFYKEWGVKSTCVAGGGEPLLNKGLTAFLERLDKNGVESGIITNGSVMTDESTEAIARWSRWCGFSMDAATPETYAKLKGINDNKFFNKVVENLGSLVKRRDKLGSRLDIAFKFLMHPENAHEIYDAAKLAKSLGVNDFHMRPVGWDNLTVTKGKPGLDFEPLIKKIEKQVEAARSLESSTFHFYGVTHKFGTRLERKINFKRCWAPPLLATFGADGKCHLCFDMRGREDLVLCSHYPEPREILKVWGSEFHRNLIKNIDPHECPRCTFGPYNEIVEQVIVQDKMCRFFP
ncbi:MAG: radical SAM protein [Deltaproteobacteria bacterium]|nr:radical SAM protein [Deltaproteobacteria bacterium]